MSGNSYGQVSRLDLLLALDSKGKTVLPHVKFTAPFKVMKPFYDEKEHCSVMMMSSSSGIMSGDRQEITVTMEEGSCATIFSQSYEKIHKMTEGHGERDTKIIQKKNSTLCFSPLPTIPYEGSHFRGNTEIVLEDESCRLVYSEVLSCGRVGMGEQFLYDHYSADLKITLEKEGEQQLLLRDRACYTPTTMDLLGFTMYEGFTHSGMLLMVQFHLSAQDLEEIQEICDGYNQKFGENKARVAYSATYSGEIVLRSLGHSGEEILKLHKEIREKVLEKEN